MRIQYCDRSLAENWTFETDTFFTLKNSADADSVLWPLSSGKLNFWNWYFFYFKTVCLLIPSSGPGGDGTLAQQ